MRASDNISEKVKMAIEYQRKDNLINHLLTIVTCKYGYSGSVNNNSFTIWSLSGWIGLLYPVILGTISDDAGKPQVILRTKLNSFGRIIVFGVFALMIYGVVSAVLMQSSNLWPDIGKRILLGIGLISILIIMFRLVYISERRRELDAIRKILNIPLKTTISTADLRFNREQYILIKNADGAKLLTAVQKMSNLYSDTPYARGIVIHKSDMQKDTYLLNFVNRPDFERFKYFVNYLHYPEVDGFSPVVAGYRTISEEDGLPEQNGQRLMLYVPHDDKERDNVHAAFDGFNSNVKLGFSFGDQYALLKLKEKKFEERPIKLSEVSLEKIINPNDSETDG